MNRKIVVIAVFIIVIVTCGLAVKVLSQKKLPAHQVTSSVSPSQVVSLSPSLTNSPRPTDVNIQEWKQFDRNSYNNNNGFTFNFRYPASWKASGGNAGPIFVSPDQKLLLSLREYQGDFDQLALQEASVSKIISKSKETVVGHPAIRQEDLSSNVDMSIINEYIGNVKIVSHWKDGSLNIQNGTVILGINVPDERGRDNVIAIFNQILSTVTFTN